MSQNKNGSWKNIFPSYSTRTRCAARVQRLKVRYGVATEAELIALVPDHQELRALHASRVRLRAEMTELFDHLRKLSFLNPVKPDPVEQPKADEPLVFKNVEDFEKALLDFLDQRVVIPDTDDIGVGTSDQDYPDQAVSTTIVEAISPPPATTSKQKKKKKREKSEDILETQVKPVAAVAKPQFSKPRIPTFNVENFMIHDPQQMRKAVSDLQGGLPKVVTCPKPTTQNVYRLTIAVNYYLNELHSKCSFFSKVKKHGGWDGHADGGSVKRPYTVVGASLAELDEALNRLEAECNTPSVGKIEVPVLDRLDFDDLTALEVQMLDLKD
jgi:hypothetical protein